MLLEQVGILSARDMPPDPGDWHALVAAHGTRSQPANGAQNLHRVPPTVFQIARMIFPSAEDGFGGPYTATCFMIEPTFTVRK